MSTRWYPLWSKGGPQLRVFLPNFWAKLIKPERTQPPNVVTFEVSMEMTGHDMKNYFTQIYKLPVVDVRSRIALGKTRRDRIKGYVTKDEDRKLAYVVLPKEVNFTFPELFPSDSESKNQKRDDEKALDASKDAFKKFLDRSKKRRGLPGWYSI